MFSRRAEPTHPNPPHPGPTVMVRPVTVRTLVVSGLLLLSVVAAVMVLSVVSSTMLLLLLGVVFAEGIRPLVVIVERWHLPRVAAILVVYVLLLVLLGILIAVLVQPVVSEVQQLVSNFPSYQSDVTNALGDLEARLHVSSNIGSQVAGSLNTAKDILLAIGAYIFAIIVNFVIVLLLGFLWLTSSDRLKIFIVNLFPTNQQPLASDVIREMGYRIGGYSYATGLNMVAVGVATGLAAWGLGLPSPILLGIFAGLTGAIPLVGPFVGAVPAALLGFTISPAYPLVVIAVFAVIQLLDANLLLPQVMNRVVALPALMVVLALLIGGAVAGIIGALLAIPLAAAAQVVLLRVIVPAIHNSQGRQDEAFARASTPLSPRLRAVAPTSGGRRHAAR